MSTKNIGLWYNRNRTLTKKYLILDIQEILINFEKDVKKMSEKQKMQADFIGIVSPLIICLIVLVVIVAIANGCGGGGGGGSPPPRSSSSSGGSSGSIPIPTNPDPTQSPTGSVTVTSTTTPTSTSTATTTTIPTTNSTTTTTVAPTSTTTTTTPTSTTTTTTIPTPTPTYNTYIPSTIVGQVSFNNAGGICYNTANDRVYAIGAIVENSQTVWGVKIFDTGLNFIAQFATGTSGTPFDVVCDSSGYIYVTYQSGGAAFVKKFTSAGDFVVQIGSAGDGVDQFAGAYGISYYDNKIYAVDSSGSAAFHNRIIVFSTGGAYISTLGQGILTQPTWVLTNATGMIVGCQTNYLKKLDLSGNLIYQNGNINYRLGGLSFAESENYCLIIDTFGGPAKFDKIYKDLTVVATIVVSSIVGYPTPSAPVDICKGVSGEVFVTDANGIVIKLR